MKYFLLLILTTFGFLFSVGEVRAATYYVSVADGNDTNCTGLAQTAYVSGSAQACPWKTLNKVNAIFTAGTFLPGDNILLKSGETFTGYNLVVKTSGTSGNIITVSSYGAGNVPLIDATGFLHGIDIRNSISNFKLENLNIRNATNDQIFIYNSASNFTINNVTAYGGSQTIYIVTGIFDSISISSTTLSGYAGSGISILSATGTDLLINDVKANVSGTRGIYMLTSYFSNVDILNSDFSNQSAHGLHFQSNVDNVEISNVTTLNNGGYGIYFNGSGENYYINNLIASNNGKTSTGFEGLFFNNTGTQSLNNINIENSTFNSNGANGIGFGGKGNGALVKNITSSNNDGDGFNIHGEWLNVVFDHCVANNNGLIGRSGAGDGFSFHDTSTGVIKNSLAKDNMKAAIAHVGTSSVLMSNNIFSHTTNGTLPLVSLYDIGSTHYLYNNLLYSAANTGSGFYLTNATAILKNNLVYGFDIGISKYLGSVDDNYDLVFNTSSSNWSGVTEGEQSFSSNPLFLNTTGSYSTSTDFQLTALSPAIDTGTVFPGMTSTTTDYSGNPIYGTPDIGAYEYQPPYTIGTHNINPTGNIRIYADGKYRYTTSTSSTLSANLRITPNETWTYTASTTRPEWLNISNITWNTDTKQWTASSNTATTTIYTIGDLRPNVQHTISVDGSVVDTIQSDTNGSITYTYTGGYSTHTFSITPIIRHTSGGSGYIQGSPYAPIVPTTTPTPTVVSTTTSTTTKYIFPRNLSLNMSGPDVLLLQKYLNTHNYILTTTGPGSPGNETSYFGSLTKRALIKYQIANRITPAVGYFGPITRGVVGK